MFGKKVSEAEYNELEQKYLTFECAYNNEHAKCSDLEKQVLELTDQIKKLREAGNVLPEDLVKRAEEAEAKASELAGLLEAEKSKNSDSGAYLQLLKGSKQLQSNYKQMYESALRELEAEKTKNAELTARLQTFSGGKTMADNQVTQWEYKHVDTDDNTLNQVGEKGWEVVGQPTGSQLLVKRPKQIKQQEPDYQVTQWEYKHVDTDDNTLNQVGEKGWEVVGQPTGSQLLVKRPKQIKQQEPDYSYSR